MPRNKTPEHLALKHRLETRVNEAKYKELQAILDKSMNMDMSTLLRLILHRQKITVYTHDRTLDMLMEQLAGIRAELKAMGVNINQMTKRFHTYPELERKRFYAKIAFDQYNSLQGRVELLLDIISKLAKKWLRE